MSVSKRKTSKGYTDDYHYRFYIGGEIYTGVCPDCHTKQDARAFEKTERERIATARSAIKGRASSRKKAEKIVSSVLGAGTYADIPIEAAFDESLKKPKKRKATGDFLVAKKSYWRDFTAFLSDKYPAVRSVKDVERKHAEGYLEIIREKGRYKKDVEWSGGKKYSRKGNYSHKTCNVIHDTLKEVFNLLGDDAGLDINPFGGIEKLDNNSATREPFTEDEIKKIFEKADDFIRPIFLIGISTALREGDICTLRWSEVDFLKNCIRRKTKKTSKLVEIPMLPPLRKFLLERRSASKKGDLYILPSHAEMYMRNSVGISRRVKKFLESLKIITDKKIDGRDRSVSVKDVHSLRHSFCYLAGLYGIPLMIVQSICGHMTPDMTAHYQRHADLKAKQTALAKMPEFLSLPGGSAADRKSPEEIRKDIDRILNAATPDQLNRIHDAVKEIVGVPGAVTPTMKAG